MEKLVITKLQLEAALLRWEQDARNGKTRSHEEADALPAEQVAAENAACLWGKLVGKEGSPGGRRKDEALFRLSHANATPDKALAAASNLEWIIGRVANGDQKAVKSLSLEDMALLVQYVRDTAKV